MNRRMTKTTVLLVLLLALIVSACGGSAPGATKDDAQNAVNQQQTYRRNGQGVPFFDFSQDLETLRQIYVLKNENVSTHTTFSSNGSGQIIDDCPSIGYPIPADTQLTNPETIADRYQGGYAILEQPEPNGLFSSKNTDGTWVICVTDSGKQYPKYSELKVEAFPFPVRVNEDRFGITPLEEPEVQIQTGGVVDVGRVAEEESPSEPTE